MDLSIIILNYKSINLVREQLRWLRREHFPFSTEIIVVDNASGDPLSLFQRDFPEARVIALKKNMGMGAGNNAGLRAAQGDFLLILNPDIIVLPCAIARLYDYMREHTRVGIAGPRLLNPDGTMQYSCFRWHRLTTPLFRRTWFSILPWGKRELDRFLMREWDHQSTRPVDWLLGAALMIRRQALQDVGRFDERFFLFLEDTDLCRRFWNKGWEVVYVANSVMLHYPQRLSSSEEWTSLFKRITWMHIVSWLKYVGKWKGWKNSKSEITNHK